MLSALCCLAIAQSTSDVSFPDIPKNHWAYEMFAKCRHLGLFPEAPRQIASLYYSGRPISCREAAWGVVHITMNLDGACESLFQQLTPPTDYSKDMVDKATAYRSIAHDLRRFDVEFKQYFPDFVRPSVLIKDTGGIETRLARLQKTLAPARPEKG